MAVMLCNECQENLARANTLAELSKLEPCEECKEKEKRFCWGCLAVVKEPVSEDGFCTECKEELC